MSTIFRTGLVGAILAASAVFSTGSISTPYYYETLIVSGLDCQSGTRNAWDVGEPLGYTTTGIVNRSRREDARANCPLAVPDTGTYVVNAVISANNRSDGGRVRCRLIEVDALTGVEVRRYGEAVRVDRNSTGLITWYDIERTVAESFFTASCRLLPGTGVVSISVAAS